jgi:hypothetical protein
MPNITMITTIGNIKNVLNNCIAIFHQNVFPPMASTGRKKNEDFIPAIP